MADKLPGRGFLGWLGRQVGYVRKAVRHPVGAKVLYQEKRVAQAPHPDRKDVTLRRTIVDEVLVEKQK
jgi:hypothetical protein